MLDGTVVGIAAGVPQVRYVGSLSPLGSTGPVPQPSQVHRLYVLKSITVTKGGKAYPGLVQMPFTILDFERKIRDKIWTYVVREEEPFFFTDYKFPGYDPQYVRQKDRGGSPRDGLALVQVSRQLENDVIPILYGSNTFHFAHVSAMNTLFRSFEPMRRYISQVQAPDPQAWRFVYFRTFWSMWPMAKLRSFIIDYRCIDWQVGKGGRKNQATLQEFFDHIKHFLRKWHEENKDRKGSGSVLDLIKLVSGVEDTKRESAADRLRKLIADDLGISL